VTRAGRTLRIERGEVGNRLLVARDGLVKFKDFLKNFGGSCDTLPE